MGYFKLNEQTTTDFSSKNITNLYNNAYLFGRPKKGYMYQTRSLRIDISKFKLSSENKRILRKTEILKYTIKDIPYEAYSWKIGKLAKDFYSTKFGDGTFSANKIKELLTTDHNFNKFFVYSIEDNNIGYAICYENKNILHYSYPFYDLKTEIKNIGMSMMLNAIDYAKKQNKQYIYLGSATRPRDVYKLQFEGLKWFDGEKWEEDLEKLKKILHKI